MIEKTIGFFSSEALIFSRNSQINGEDDTFQWVISHAYGCILGAKMAYRPIRATGTRDPLWVSFILLVLASVVAKVGVFTTVPNRALAVLIILIKIKDSAVRMGSTLAAYIIVIGQNSNVENTLFKTVWYPSLLV